MEEGQNTPRGHPDFDSYIKKSTYFHMERTDKQTDEQTDGEINLVWAGYKFSGSFEPAKM